MDAVKFLNEKIGCAKVSGISVMDAKFTIKMTNLCLVTNI